MNEKTSNYLNFVVVNAMDFFLSLGFLYLFYKIGAQRQSAEKDKMSALI